MKIIKKVILVSVFCVTFLSIFLLPTAHAQEWTYEGVDTEHIPNYSVYPSEWYVYNATGDPDEMLLVLEVVRGNISDPFMTGNGTCVWTNTWMWNTISGEKTLSSGSVLTSYWNKTVGYFSYGDAFIIPVEEDGTLIPFSDASVLIFGNISEYYWTTFLSLNMEYVEIYYSYYSIAFWNETYNNAYVYFNYSNYGILTGWESYLLPLGNLSLYSRPAQLPPVFNFTTENSNLTVNVKDVDLKVSINDVDNNNDGITDADYQYRIFYGSTWTSWSAITTLIDFDLGSVTAGNYTVIMEVKNMYGTTQEQIEIQYEQSGDGDKKPPILGYSTILITIAILIGVSFLILKNRVKK